MVYDLQQRISARHTSVNAHRFDRKERQPLSERIAGSIDP
jgi:hypothetical protein